MNSTFWYISSIAPDTGALSRRHGLGVEIAEYCTAWNMDEKFAGTDKTVRATIENVEKLTLHAPFNELFPCAIDPKARILAKERYLQAISLAENYGADRVVIHGGYNPRMYYPIWYTEQSAVFWREFMGEYAGKVRICLENVFEETPDMLTDIIKAVNDPRLGMCLDIGHVNAYSKIPPLKWLEACAPYIYHYHIHNNSADFDSHSALCDGTIPMKELLTAAAELTPDATKALEVLEAAPSVNWLIENEFIEA